MRKRTIALCVVPCAALALYGAGPRPAAPTFRPVAAALPASLPALEAQINTEERATPGLKPDNRARILWADSAARRKTPVAFLYLHGFTGSPQEAAPIPADLRRAFGANVYLFRNRYHGVDVGDSTMAHATADDYLAAAERALAIAERLGDRVVVMGSSLGGVLALYLASRHPEVRALVLYSPAVAVDGVLPRMLVGPWGVRLATLANGSPYIDVPETNPLNRQYWTMRYHLDGAAASLQVVAYGLPPGAYAAVRCPVFVGYWYKDAREHDRAASVPAMLRMYDALGTPVARKRKQNFPDAGNHGIASPITSRTAPAVARATERFLREVVFVEPGQAGAP